MKDRLVELLTPWEEPKNSGRTICPADLLLLTRLIERRGLRKVIEFGCGVTTKEMNDRGVDVTTFSLEVSNPINPEGIDFVKCDLTDPEIIERVRTELDDTDLLVIDADHSWNFAKMYHENYIRFYDGLIWIHDYFKRPLCGEQSYLDKHVIGVTHKKILVSDLPQNLLKEVAGKIDYPIHEWSRDRVKQTKACLCCVVLERL